MEAAPKLNEMNNVPFDARDIEVQRRRRHQHKGQPKPVVREIGCTALCTPGMGVI
jgi:hypothetical protein